MELQSIALPTELPAVPPISVPYSFFSSNSFLFGLLSNNLLPNVNYNLTWNSNVYNVTDGDPLQISETNAANFLNSGVS